MTTDAAPRSSRRAPPRRADFRIFEPVETRWADNDAYGHLNNVVHYALFDTAVNRRLVAAGLLDIQTGETIGLVVESGCRFHASVAFPDPLEVGLRVERIGTSSVQYAVALFKIGDPEAAADGVFVHVYVDRQTRRPRPLDPLWRDTLAGWA